MDYIGEQSGLGTGKDYTNPVWVDFLLDWSDSVFTNQQTGDFLVRFRFESDPCWDDHDLCDSGSPPIDAWPTSGGGTVDATLACDVLAGWNRRDDIESVGVPIWRQFFRRLGRQVDKFSVPFDPADPINTPNTLILNNNVITKPLTEATMSTVINASAPSQAPPAASNLKSP